MSFIAHALALAANSSQRSPDHTLQYQAIDKIITKSMLHAESAVNQNLYKKFQWSPLLKIAVQATLLLKYV
jgi:hypothetical protein